MRLFFTKDDTRLLSLILAAALLVSSIPLTAGVMIVAGPRHAEISANFCHPPLTLDRAANTLIARPAAVRPIVTLCDQGSVRVMVLARLASITLAPDIPPPKAAI